MFIYASLKLNKSRPVYVIHTSLDLLFLSNFASYFGRCLKYIVIWCHFKFAGSYDFSFCHFQSRLTSLKSIQFWLVYSITIFIVGYLKLKTKLIKMEKMVKFRNCVLFVKQPCISEVCIKASYHWSATAYKTSYCSACEQPLMFGFCLTALWLFLWKKLFYILSYISYKNPGVILWNI